MTEPLRAVLRAFIAAGLAFGALQSHATDGGAAVIIDSDTNMVLMGGRVRPPHPIPQNFAAAGGSIVIDQPIGHNAAMAGGSVEVRAPIGHNVAAAGGTVTIDSPVGGRVGAAGGEVRLTKNAVVGGSAGLTGSRMDVDGIVHGSLHAVGETLTINGVVDGDVDADVESIILGPGAKVSGSITYVGADLKKDESATIGGEVKKRGGTTAREKADEAVTVASAVVGWIATGLVFLLLLACGAIFLAVAPIFSVEAPDRLRASPGQSLGIGLLTVVGAPIAAVLFMFTIVGIPVGVIIFALYPLALLLGFVVGILWLASWGAQLAKHPPPPTVAKAIVYFGLALLALTLIGRIPVLGGVLAGLLLVMGVGAFEVELFRRMRAGSGAMRGRVEVVRP